MEFNMCNVIILLNKPLEEDIPFTTCSKAGRFRCFWGFFNVRKHAAGWGGGGGDFHAFFNEFAVHD